MLERFDDGRLNILVEGADPFRLVRRIDDLPYPAGEVSCWTTSRTATPSPLDAVREHLRRPRGARHRGAARGRRTGRLDAYGMAATLDVALDAKQSLLEQRAESDRLDALKELFAAAIERIELVEKAAERSRGNGSMHS